MSYCRVSTCYNKKANDGLKFFSFPRGPTLCEQWVIFCCCAQTEDVFYAGGVFALKSYAICANHFDPGAFASPGRLVKGAVPKLKPGRTLPVALTVKPVVLREPVMGVTVREKQEETAVKREVESKTDEVVVEQNDEEPSTIEFEVIPIEKEAEKMLVLDAIPNEVLVEMLDPEDIKEETLSECEGVESVYLEKCVSNEIETIEIQDDKDVTIKTPQHRSNCIFATGKLSNFEERYKRQIWLNKNTENQIEIEKRNYAQMVEKYQKTNELLTVKRRKKQQFQRKLQEYKRKGPEALLRSADSANAKSCDDYSDSSVDETSAWW